MAGRARHTPAMNRSTSHQNPRSMTYDTQPPCAARASNADHQTSGVDVEAIRVSPPVLVRAEGSAESSALRSVVAVSADLIGGGIRALRQIDHDRIGATFRSVVLVQFVAQPSRFDSNNRIDLRIEGRGTLENLRRDDVSL